MSQVYEWLYDIPIIIITWREIKNTFWILAAGIMTTDFFPKHLGLVDPDYTYRLVL